MRSFVLKLFRAMKKTAIIPMFPFRSERLPLKVQTIRDLLQEQQEWNPGPHSHNYYEMTWVTRGAGLLHADMQDYTVGSNTFFCLKPGQVHQFKMSPETEGYVFSFTESFFRMGDYDVNWDWESILFQLFNEKRMTLVTSDEADELRTITLDIVKEMESQYSNRISLVRGYFTILLIHLTRSLKGEIQWGNPSKEKQLIKRFFGLVDAQFKENKMVEEYAAQLCLTPNYLNRTVKRNTGSSAGDHIRQRVVLEAKRMARFSRASLKEIADELGFLDYPHFSRFFKTFGGMNFSEFKREADFFSPNI